MGWDSDLKIGPFLECFRKHVPDLPALLFSAGEVVVEAPSDWRARLARGDLSGVRSRFSTTAARATDRLAELGFDWTFVVELHGEVKAGVGGFAQGVLIQDGFQRGLSEEEAAAEVEAFLESDAAGDLEALIECLRSHMESTTGAEEYEGFIGVDTLPGGSDDDSININSEFRIPIAWDDPRKFRALRAAGFLSWIRRNSPYFGWICFASLLLRVPPPGTEVVLDFSDFWNNDDDDREPADFAETHLVEAVANVADHARLVGRLFSLVGNLETKAGRAFLEGQVRGLLAQVRSRRGTRSEKGKQLEQLLELLVRIDPQFELAELRFRAEEQELDLVLRNEGADPFWSRFRSPMVFVECKNWEQPVGVDEARVFGDKLRERAALCNVGIFVASHGFTKPFRERIKRLQGEGLIVFCLDADDIEESLTGTYTLSSWIKEKGVRQVI